MEEKAINALLEKGVVFNLNRKKYHLKEATLGMLDEISALQLQMTIDENRLDDNQLIYTKQLVKYNAELAAEIVAIMLVGSKGYSHIPIVDNILSWVWGLKVKSKKKEVFQNLKPSELVNIAMITLQLSNSGDFINSIRLMSANRTTAPKNRVETQD